jgi:hypothetical protein
MHGLALRHGGYGSFPHMNLGPQDCHHPSHLNPNHHDLQPLLRAHNPSPLSPHYQHITSSHLFLSLPPEASNLCKHIPNPLPFFIVVYSKTYRARTSNCSNSICRMMMTSSAVGFALQSEQLTSRMHLQRPTIMR